jgi:glutamate--cysteine ligase
VIFSKGRSDVEPISVFNEKLARLRALDNLDQVFGVRIGLEKESLRVAANGHLAQTPHPAAWGAALTHAGITTDYSESLPEFITPPMSDAGRALDFLADLQSYAYQRLPGEMLWATSMPCALSGDGADIPIADYGRSNLGRMKRIYRIGLGHRYGRVMQIIAGVHFNWSMTPTFWPVYRRLTGAEMDVTTLRDATYMGLTRNILRFGWLIPYLFGASPAVCQTFFPHGQSDLPKFDEQTYYEPYATSLRMGDIGYQNSKEEGLGFKVCYNDVKSYARSLLHAITTPTELWRRIGVKIQGDYRQLNTNILQIENEYYSSVRPKQPLAGLESPALALLDRGIDYIELRSLDVNAYHPLGVDEEQLRFLESFMLTSLLLDSPPLTQCEQMEANQNLLKVAHYGREPGLTLERNGHRVTLQNWGMQFMHMMLPVAELLDQIHQTDVYADALDEQMTKIRHAELTPSARMLREMHENGEGFYDFARRLSTKHHRFFNERSVSSRHQAEFDAMSAKSYQRLEEIESTQQQDFDQFLANYFAPIERAVK